MYFFVASEMYECFSLVMYMLVKCIQMNLLPACYFFAIYCRIYASLFWVYLSLRNTFTYFAGEAWKEWGGGGSGPGTSI